MREFFLVNAGALSAEDVSPIKEAVIRALAITLGLIGALVCSAPSRAVGPSQESIQQVIRQVFPDDSQRALCIADYESDGTPHHWSPAAQNGRNTGLFQIDEDTWDWRRNVRAIPIVGRLDWSRMHDALYNARAARRIYLYTKARYGNGWLPWSTRGLCGA